MKILIDIGHPAHVHYFKNLIKILESKGHKVFVMSRKKEIAFDLLKAYNISFKSRGKGRNSLFGKIYYLVVGSIKVFRYAVQNKADLLVSFASPYNAIASAIYHRKCITLDDTEHNLFNHKVYLPFTDCVLTPEDFKLDFGKKQVRFNATTDVAYLHPKYFSAKKVRFEENSNQGRKNVIVRLVSWKASHDINQFGFRKDEIENLVLALSKIANVYISSEKKIPDHLSHFALKIKPEEMHDYMAAADLFISESGSMATESVYLGTHSIVLNSAARDFGVFERLSKFETFNIANDYPDLLEKSFQLLAQHNLKEIAKSTSLSIFNDCINLTDFLVWFIENYPESKRIMQENPDYQMKFK